MRRRGLGPTRFVGLGVALTSSAAIFTALVPAAAQQTPSSVPPTTLSPSTTEAVTTTAPPPVTTTIAPFIVTPRTAPPGTSNPSSPSSSPPSTMPDTPSTPDGQPAASSLSNDTVASILDSMARSSPSSTDALLAALRPLQDYGISAIDAAMMGMGRFPVGGAAYYRDDFGDHRDGPPVHPHAGNDIFAAFDTPVRAPAEGRVEFADSGLGGKSATVTEPDGTYYYMAHLNGFAPDLASGSLVKAGQLVGFNGDSGNARGGAPHVHFEIHPKGGAAVNPKPILDQWLADALAAVPTLLAPYSRTIQQGGESSRPIIAVGLARHMERGMLDGPSRLMSRPPDADPAAPQSVADALVYPLTPARLQPLP